MLLCYGEHGERTADGVARGVRFLLILHFAFLQCVKMQENQSVTPSKKVKRLDNRKRKLEALFNIALMNDKQRVVSWDCLAMFACFLATCTAYSTV